MLSLNYDIRKELLHKKFKFVTLFSGFQKVDLKSDLMNKLMSSDEIFKSDLIVFDTMSEFLIRSDIDLKGCFTLVSDLKNKLRENKSMVFCVDPSMINEKFLGVLRSVSDVYLKLEEKELYGNRIRLMKIERFNGAAGDIDTEVPFKVKSGVGILPELTS
jgi:archaellum biogenesis ATPase FlaH